MSETVNQEATTTAVEQDKTFSQADVDRIVADRLTRERAKYGDYETLKDKAAKYDAAAEAGKTELQKAQERADMLQRELDKHRAEDAARQMRQSIAEEMKIPADLLTGDNEEQCRTQAQKILDFAKPGSYPNVPDGGEVRETSANTTRDQFKNWFEDQLK